LPDRVTLEETIAANLATVRQRISSAAEASGRPGGDVRLIAVSKTFGLDHVRAAVAAGQREFGENRVQEATGKVEGWDGVPLEWHLVGHLQSNKARKAAGVFAWVHSVDGESLLRRLDQAAQDLGAGPRLLIQVDLAGEETKHGTPPDTLRRLLDVAESCRAARVSGLMLMPPFTDDPEEARPYFRRLRELRDQLLSSGSNPDLLRELSMGMSHDYEVAIGEGATMVRVGTAIFGGRPPAGEP
jgi:PLP dependent protein